MHSPSFNAHHSPLGAYASFSCGLHGAGGGLSIAGVAPPTHPLNIGYARAGTLHQLPFSLDGENSNLDNFAEELDDSEALPSIEILDGSQRTYAAGTDRWTAGSFQFTIHTPVWDLPDPEIAGDAVLQDVLLPAVVCDLSFDNSDSSDDCEVIFAITPGSRINHLLPGGGLTKAVTWDRHYALAAIAEEGVTSWVHWDAQEYIREHRSHRLGMVAGVSKIIPAGQRGSMKVILAFHDPQAATTGIEAKPWYLRRYGNLASVIDAAAQRYDSIVSRTAEMDQELEQSGLDQNQQFLISHAQRSYWGNTHLLDHCGKPLWIVYEGEYAMINTFDLAVDQCFYEMRRNPWVVRNLCDQFVSRYSYYDRLNRPPADAAQRAKRATMCRDPHRLHELVPEPVERNLPGGISFSHDMGVYPHFMPPGESSYEISGLAGCFSYMTCEQLYNWICMAVTYVTGTDDWDWAQQNRAIFKECLVSLLNRDDPKPSQRNGLNSLDSDACGGGWEITTYDSLDHSLGQARNNGYMAVKGWAACLGLELILGKLGELKLQVDAFDQARRAAEAVVSRFNHELGYLPAVFEGSHMSAIIPAIEGVVFPLQWGMDKALAQDGPYAKLHEVLGLHLQTILQPGMCLFDDGGWKLSSSADNSWMSKIFICQYVSESVYGIRPDTRSHSAHVHWQQVGSAEWAMSDQCVNGVAKGSRYYPRCVTNDLWLAKPNESR